MQKKECRRAAAAASCPFLSPLLAAANPGASLYPADFWRNTASRAQPTVDQLRGRFVPFQALEYAARLMLGTASDASSTACPTRTPKPSSSSPPAAVQLPLAYTTLDHYREIKHQQRAVVNRRTGKRPLCSSVLALQVPWLNVPCLAVPLFLAMVHVVADALVDALGEVQANKPTTKIF